MTYYQFPSIRNSAFGLAVVLGSIPIFAQAPVWNTPSTIYVHDSVGRTVRPIVGVIGSSYPGSVLLDGVEWASFALNHKSALVYRNGVLAWVPNLSVASLDAEFSTYGLANVPLPQRAVWAADSSRAVVLASGTPRLIWLGQSESSAEIVASWDLDSSQTNWSILAADSLADQVLAASQDGDASQLWLVSQRKAPVRVAGFSQPVAAVFANGNSSAYVADAATHQIVLLRGLNTSPVAVQFLASETYVADPVGLAVSGDGTHLFLADGSDKIVRVFQTSGGALSAELPLQVVPTSLTPFSASSFLLEGRTQKEQPFFFLDTRAGGQVFFVPAGR